MWDNENVLSLETHAESLPGMEGGTPGPTMLEGGRDGSKGKKMQQEPGRGAVCVREGTQPV